MRGTLIVYRRELGALFFTPLAWILLTGALLLNGYLFATALGDPRSPGDVTAAIEVAFGGHPIFWALVIMLAPLVTMRLVTEEAANGTLEYLRTAPVSDAVVVIGKFLAGLTFLAVLWSSIVLYAGMIHLQGVTPDWGQVFAILIGAVLVSGMFVALGMAASALTNIPLLGAFLSFMACLWWLILPWVGVQLNEQLRPLWIRLFDSAELAEDVILGAVDRMAVFQHFGRTYYRGVVDSAELVFFLTWIAFFLFLTTRVLEARRWRG